MNQSEKSKLNMTIKFTKNGTNIKIDILILKLYERNLYIYIATLIYRPKITSLLSSSA